MSCGCTNSEPGCAREAIFKSRVQTVLGALACQFPSLFIRVDFWRPRVVEITDGYADSDVEKWVRLAESVEAFVLEQPERFFQSEVGIINQTNRFLIIPEGLGLRPDDHVIVQGEAWLIVEAVEQAGVAKVKLDRTKNRFVRPGRFDPTYRQIGVKVAIL